MNWKLLTVAAAIAIATPTVAQAPEQTVRVQFAKGASSKAIKGSIKGYQGVSYLVGARAGQTMTVDLKSGNTSNYFNIWAPGADAALYNSSAGENRHSFEIPSSGDYRVQVYLMRNAARRNETANYTLTISVK